MNQTEIMGQDLWISQDSSTTRRLSPDNMWREIFCLKKKREKNNMPQGQGDGTDKLVSLKSLEDSSQDRPISLPLHEIILLITSQITLCP